MRGEYEGEVIRGWSLGGSPPHAWGILVDGLRQPRRQRFTPTCVGNTAEGAEIIRRRSVHPHMRGEYINGIVGQVTRYGSPPHAWGIL